MKIYYNIPKRIKSSKSSFKREVHRDKYLPQEIRKMSQINNLVSCFKGLEKEQKNSKIVEKMINKDKDINKWKRLKDINKRSMKLIT